MVGASRCHHLPASLCHIARPSSRPIKSSPFVMLPIASFQYKTPFYWGTGFSESSPLIPRRLGVPFLEDVSYPPLPIRTGGTPPTQSRSHLPTPLLCFFIGAVYGWVRPISLLLFLVLRERLAKRDPNPLSDFSALRTPSFGLSLPVLCDTSLPKCAVHALEPQRWLEPVAVCEKRWSSSRRIKWIAPLAGDMLLTTIPRPTP